MDLMTQEIPSHPAARFAAAPRAAMHNAPVAVAGVR